MYWSNGMADLHLADAREIPLPDSSVHMCVTSPPYWGLRNYSLNDGIGLEPTLDEHLANVVAVFREVRRVLRDDGTLWLNYGDAYANSNPGWDGNGRGLNGVNRKGSETMIGKASRVAKLPAKNLIGLPWRVAFALQDDGWILRSAIVWHKPNPMPESVRDRPTNAYETIFLFAKKPRYFYDAEAIRQPYSEAALSDKRTRANGYRTQRDYPGAADMQSTNLGENKHGGANARNVWTIPTQGRPDAHFATFPDELPRRCILAGTSEHGVCSECGAQWERVVDKATGGTTGQSWHDHSADAETGNAKVGSSNGYKRGETLGWQPTCDCGAGIQPATVLDPFVGSGTTLAVAQSLGRRGVGLDLNEEYLGIARRRIEAVSLPLLVGA